MSATRQRVLMFTASLGYGGSESDFLRLAHFLALEMDVTIALMARDYNNANYSNAGSTTNLPVVLIDVMAPAEKGYINKILRWLGMFRRLRNVKKRFDVTLSFLSGPNLLNAATGGPAIVSERGSKLYHVGMSARSKWLWLRMLDPISYTLAACIVPVSKAYATEVAHIAGKRNSPKIRAIEGSINATDLITISEGKSDQDIMQFCAATTAVYSGRLDRGKGIDLLIPIFASVRRRNPGARLLVIGDGPQKQELATLCIDQGLKVTYTGERDADVFFAGFRSDPIRHFKLCKVFCFPSLHEGLPNALIEGVASGILVLAADCPWGPRSILAACKNDQLPAHPIQIPHSLPYGVLMPLPNSPNGAASWESALEQALTNGPAKRRELSANLRAVERFDIRVTGLQWIEIIREVAKPLKVS